MGKITLYFLITILVIISLDSININNIFKKNKVFQARLFYFFLAVSLIYSGSLAVISKLLSF